MRSVDEDQTTRARIRDAAIGLFGQRGFARATIREIAVEAQVSAGLVIHHFGTKDALRAACDAHVLENAGNSARSSSDPEQLRDVMTEYLARPEEYGRELAYIRQAVIDDSSAGGDFFDAYVRLTEHVLAEGVLAGTMREVDDPRATATWLVSNSLGLLVLGRHVARSLGHEEFGPATVNRVSVPAVELYTHPLYTDESFLRATRDVVASREPGKDRHGKRH